MNNYVERISVISLCVVQGVTEPSLRLSVSRICQVLSEMEQIRDVFRKQIVVR